MPQWEVCASDVVGELMSTIHEVIQEEATPGKGVHARTQQATKGNQEGEAPGKARGSYNDSLTRNVTHTMNGTCVSI